MAKPGDPFLDVYTAAWYNKVDKAVNKKLTGIPAIHNLSQQSWIWVSNHEAVAKDQFTVVAIGDPSLLLSDRLDNITNETVWETTDPLAIFGGEYDIFILLDPLPGEIGAQARALVSGVSLLKTKTFLLSDAPYQGDFFNFLGPDNTDLITNNIGRIQVLNYFYVQWYVESISDVTLESEFDYYLVVAGAIGGTGSGGDAKLAVTPSGGIAAMTTDTAPYTFPSEVCDLVDEFGALTGATETIYNMVMMGITGDALIQLKKIGTRYFVDVDNCPASVISS